MLCVLAPGISFAFGDGSRVAPCLTDEIHVLGFFHVHDHGESPAHVHKDGHMHEHLSIHAHSGQSDRPIDVVSAAAESTIPANESQKNSEAQCCGMVSVSALPATIGDIVKPSSPTSVRDSETYRNIVDNVPPRLYRPPIS
jgi:hypothetical protein